MTKIAAALLVALLCQMSASVAQPFSFGAIGDTGYSKASESELDQLIQVMNKEKLSFVVHVGDFEADPRPYLRDPEKISKPCSDDHYQKVLGQFQKSAHPFILTPGDNDWTDCHLLKLDPLERLSSVRRIFYPAGKSLGLRQLAVTSQAKTPGFSKFVENLFWSVNRVSFVTLHIVGSNDNKGRTPEMDAEATERTAANLSWLRKAFEQARQTNALGLVVMTQANPGFETHWTPSLTDRYFRIFPGVTPPKQLPPSGFDELLNVLETEMQSFSKPVLFIHGDTHIFHISKPLVNKKTQRFFANFTRLEVFGDPDTHWVKVRVDPTHKELFAIEPKIISSAGVALK